MTKTCFLIHIFNLFFAVKFPSKFLFIFYIKYLKSLTFPTIHRAHIDLTVDIRSQEVKGIVLKL